MKVSIITVCFNSQKTIEDTIKSVQSQSYTNIEYIIVDGQSTDCTNDIINQYSDIVDIHISEPDKGLYDAMNKGIGLATGDVVGILNSDDFFENRDCIKDIVSLFDSPKVDVVYSDLVYVSQSDVSKITRLYSSKIFKPCLIRYGFMLPHPTFYARKECYSRFGLYKDDYKVAADFELIARFIKNNVVCRRLPKVTVVMREGGVSSRDLISRFKQNYEVVRACRENGIYTNIFLILMKVPYKILALSTRWFIRRSDK